MCRLSKFIIISCLFQSSVFAEPTEVMLEPITVSGSKLIAPSFNSEALSKNEIYASEVIEQDIKEIKDISRRIPNFYAPYEAIGTYGQRFVMRGLTNTSLFSEPAVVFYVDDVPYSSASATMGQLFDVDSIDVYRSAQPGLFGKNAYAGAVNIKTRQPENKLSGDVALELGSFNLHQVTANSSGALIDDELYFSVGGQFFQRDGFLYNNYLNSQPDETENFSGRASLKWTPTKDWDMQLILTKDDFDYGATRFVRLDSPDFFTVQSELDEKMEEHADSQALRIAHTTADYELLSVSSRRFWSMDPRAVDLDLLPTLYTRLQTAKDETWTQEFRLQPKNKNLDWQWQAGLFYANDAQEGDMNVLFLSNNLLTDTHVELKERDTDSYALFGQLAYQGFNGLKPYLDLRLDYVDASVDASSTYPTGTQLFLQQQDSTFFVSPKFGLDYNFSPNLLFYTATGLGFKPAGFSIANLEQNLSHYDKETSWQNEIGMKSNWFDERLKLNLAGFYYDIDDYQVERFFTAFDYGVTNAPKAHSYGFEVESQAEMVKNLWLQTGIGYTHTEFDNYIDPVTGVDYAGKTAPFVPDYTGTVALEYKHPQGYFARAEWLWTGLIYFDENNTDLMGSDAYSVANLRIGYVQKNYSIYAFANNITDTQYYTFKIRGVRGAPGDPKMLGVRLGVSF